ncbi:MAG TPA: metalloregulator ArsR/SmtB family transcription factor [Candidatus Paceibacterota bacterium]|nr:metalloregulator ArsR/SmtB family transcription factor [Verrucomicrobiota bacterium]HRY49371.1 metalloregulator ArsR/SmtB family transcription factor [Candidatus Paceibacterota bacterium]HSA00150.1 metalloregulator ArsR/SmtB family transcription factor [Candidatus Paceibacterota bacterium]
MTRHRETGTPGERTGRPLSDAALELIAVRFRALGEPNRLRLIQALAGGERNVGELISATGLTQTNVSRHLGVLIDAGILGRRKVGLLAYYHIADRSILDLCRHVCGSVEKRIERQADLFSN